LIRAIVPPLVGVVLATLAAFGLVYSQNKAPSSNPADAQILSYGTPAT